jgi:hypothetical protein
MVSILHNKEQENRLSIPHFSRSNSSDSLARLSLEVKGNYHVTCGYGQCSKCACQAYEGNDQVCGNCGHNYQAHY